LLKMARLAWITGSGGLIGSNIARAAAEFAPCWTVRPLARPDLDLRDFAAVKSAFDSEHPDLIIHCAAMSRSPDCEASPALAHKINVQATLHLAELAADTRFVFFSTDLVFDGSRGDYDESAAVNPLTVYAETKARAEQAVLANSKHMVIRTSLTGGVSPTGDRGFNEQLRMSWQKGLATRLFTDEFRCPIPASVTARAVWEMVESQGLYHLAGTEKLSRWQIGKLVAARWPQLDPKLEAASLRDFAGPPRAPDTSLVCAKAQKLLSFTLPTLTEWLESNPKVEF
jgi:dTDP-4-dehydrorhamnose reductase